MTPPKKQNMTEAADTIDTLRAAIDAAMGEPS